MWRGFEASSHDDCGLGSGRCDWQYHQFIVFRKPRNMQIQIHGFLSLYIFSPLVAVSVGWVIIYRKTHTVTFCNAKILKQLPVFFDLLLIACLHVHSLLLPPLLLFRIFLFLLFCFSIRAIMVSHKEFASAGKQPGLQVWRIENLDLKPVPKALHGCFYTGDAYLLLFTTSAPSYNIHMWLGKRWSSEHYKTSVLFCDILVFTMLSYCFWNRNIPLFKSFCSIILP